MATLLQTFSIIFLTFGLFLLFFKKISQNQKETFFTIKIPLILITFSAILSVIIFFIPNKDIQTKYPIYSILSPDYDRILSAESTNMRKRYETFNPYDETEFSYILNSEFVNSINEYRERANIAASTEIKIGVSSITYDSIFATKYLTHIFSKFPITKSTYIRYYSERGWNFNENSSLNVLAKALHNRNSHQITLTNNENYYTEYFDMGRLCPPNCPN